jgi:hypothetical protein
MAVVTKDMKVRARKPINSSGKRDYTLHRFLLYYQRADAKQLRLGSPQLPEPVNRHTPSEVQYKIVTMADRYSSPNRFSAPQSPELLAPQIVNRFGIIYLGNPLQISGDESIK